MSFWEIVKAFIPLLFIVGLLYGVLVFIRRYGVNGKGKKSGSVSIDVISSQMIMPKKYISVVRVEDRLLVLGVSEQSITLLKELEQTAQVNNNSGYDEDKSNLLDILKKNLGMK